MDIATLLAAVPGNCALYAALFVIACKIITVFVRPPAESSKWAPVFRIVSTIALNIGWAENRLQIGMTGVMVPRAEVPAAKAAIEAAHVPVAGPGSNVPISAANKE